MDFCIEFSAETPAVWHMLMCDVFDIEAVHHEICALFEQPIVKREAKIVRRLLELLIYQF